MAEIRIPNTNDWNTDEQDYSEYQSIIAMGKLDYERWAERNEDWLRDQTFHLYNDPEVIGTGSAWPSSTREANSHEYEDAHRLRIR